MNNYIFHRHNGEHVMFSADEIIANGKEQKEKGILPMYARKWGENDYSKPGYLVISMWDGCAVAVEHKPGKWGIITGRQGEFTIMLPDKYEMFYNEEAKEK